MSLLVFAKLILPYLDVKPSMPVITTLLYPLAQWMIVSAAPTCPEKAELN